MFSKNFKISNLNLSNKSKAIIIAEIGINHVILKNVLK